VVLAASDCTGDVAQVEPGRRVHTDAESFRTAFLRTQQVEVAVPVVDFERHAVLALFRGRRPQCGSTIGASLRDVGARVEITVTARDACGGDDSVAYPFSFIRIPRLSKPFVFLERTEAARCD
jgi:hypothetical protein